MTQLHKQYVYFNDRCTLYKTIELKPKHGDECYACCQCIHCESKCIEDGEHYWVSYIDIDPNDTEKLANTMTEYKVMKQNAQIQH